MNWFWLVWTGLDWFHPTSPGITCIELILTGLNWFWQLLTSLNSLGPVLPSLNWFHPENQLERRKQWFYYFLKDVSVLILNWFLPVWTSSVRFHLASPTLDPGSIQSGLFASGFEWFHPVRSTSIQAELILSGLDQFCPGWTGLIQFQLVESGSIQFSSVWSWPVLSSLDCSQLVWSSLNQSSLWTAFDWVWVLFTLN